MNWAATLFSLTFSCPQIDANTALNGLLMNNIEFTNSAALSYYELQLGNVLLDGWYILWTKTHGIHSYHASDISSLANKIGELQGYTNVYVGMALQKTKPEPGKRGTGANSAAICGVWIEIDCREGVHKEKAENLPTKDVALGILKGLPVIPTAILDSGGGFHAHWWFDAPLVFNADEERQRGQELVRRFQQAVADVFRQQGYKVDTTSDLARVLRPPMTFNHKSGQPIMVSVEDYVAEARYTVEQLEAYCQPVVPPQVASTAPLIPLPGHAVQSGLNHTQYPPVEFQSVIDGCAWLRHCRDDAAALPEPEWFAALSIVARCVDGHKHAHDISIPYPDYTASETDLKVGHALSGGPRTCASIEANLNAAPYCTSCPHRRRMSSPISLGFLHSMPLVTPVVSMLPSAPVSAHAVVPGKALLSTQAGIEVMEKDSSGNMSPRCVFPAPVLVVERLQCIHTRKEQVKLAWYIDGEWRFETVDRKVIADFREIVCLASFGLPITTDNKDHLGRFLHMYLIENQSCIPVVRLSSRFGWQDDFSCFLWGRNLITAEGIWILSNVPKSDGLIATGGHSVVFMGNDDGDEQVADGFRCEGSLENWIDVANRAMDFQTPLVILLASLVPPLLEVIGASNFVVETAGTTSTGKTTVQRLAASVWGCPDERSEASCLYTWDTTRVWVERTAGLLNGLPLILDDTKRVFSSLPKEQARAMVNSVIYAYASGKGRGRGSVQGTQRTGSFRSVLISSGEQPCAESSAEHGGARARVLSLWGSPFGAGDQGALVKEITLAVLENYGFAGPILVLYLLKNYDSWPIWKGEYRAALQHYADLAAGNNVAGRLGEIFAVLEVTAQRLLEAVPGLVLQHPVRETLEEIWATTVAGAAQDADRALAALRDIWEWTAANPSKFFGRHRMVAEKALEPIGGWLGRWDATATFDHVAYLGKPIKARLEALGYDAAATTRTWADRGWLLLDSKGRSQKSVRIDAVSAKAYCIPRRVFEVELGLDLTPAPTSPTVPVSARHNPFQTS